MATAPYFSFNATAFRAQFPAFADATAYPTATLQMYFDEAGFIIANTNYGPLFRKGATLYCLYLVTAHLAQLGTLILNGQSSGITVAAAIDKISTAIQEIKLPNQWQYWLASTEYGKQLLAILQVQSVGGYYAPGCNSGRAGFRY